MDKKRVGILRGGAGREYAHSLKRGGEIIAHIFDNLGDKYQTHDILIDKDYIWHLNGRPISPSDLREKIDIAWNTTHPSFSNILESLSIPHVSTPAFPAGLQNSKELLREHMKNAGIPMPRSLLLPLYQKDFSAQGGSASGGDGSINKYVIRKAKEVHEKFGAPWIVKSFTPDSNMGIHLAKTFPELMEAIMDGVRHRQSILVEEFIPGKVGSIHSVAGFRGEDIYTFPVLDAGQGGFSAEEKTRLAKWGKNLHRHSGVQHYLKADFVVTPRGKIYLLNIESTPDLRPDSHFSQAAASVGAKMHHIVEHILKNV